jgi:hypothetical protein
MSGMRSRHGQIANWCVHFNGLQHDACRVDIPYAGVRAEKPDGTALWPCFADHDAAHLCAACRFPTEEEIAARIAKADAAIAKFAADLDNDLCPHCGQRIAHYRQVMRSVYADPCGHRLYQGKVPKGKGG